MMLMIEINCVEESNFELNKQLETVEALDQHGSIFEMKQARLNDEQILQDLIQRVSQSFYISSR